MTIRDSRGTAIKLGTVLRSDHGTGKFTVSVLEFKNLHEDPLVVLESTTYPNTADTISILGRNMRHSAWVVEGTTMRVEEKTQKGVSFFS